MSETEKPLHVRVAEIVEGRVYTLSPYVVINEHRVELPTWIPEWATADKAPAGWYAGWKPQRYDTDWAATGPLVERFKITVMFDVIDRSSWAAYLGARDDIQFTYDESAYGKTPLIAICNLILALKEAGKL